MQNDVASDTATALHAAAHSGDIERVVSLLAAGADCDASKMADEQTPLMAAAEAGFVEVVRRLLDYGAAVNTTNNFGETALTLAADRGRTETAAVLIDWRADVNVVDEFGETPLRYAAWGEHEATLRLLLKHGADPDVPIIGHTAMTTALLFRSPRILAILLAGGADPNLRHGDQTPLMMALGDEASVRLLLAHGADITLRDRHGKTALQQAVEDCAHDAVPLLKAAGAKV